MIFEDSDDQLEYIKKKMYENVGTTKYLNFFLVDGNLATKIKIDKKDVDCWCGSKKKWYRQMWYRLKRRLGK